MWFGNLSISIELQRFYYFQEKIQSAAVQFFSLKNDIKTLISKVTVFISYEQDSEWTTKMAQKFFLGPLPLNPQGGLSMNATQASTPWTKPQKNSQLKL